MRKFATLVQFQGQGIGSHFLFHILAVLSVEEVSEFWCDARVTAANFCHQFGLVTQGDQFYKSGVAYFRMRMSLS